MVRSKQILALFLAVLWVPLMSHCLLEDLGILPKDECCQKEVGPCHQEESSGGCQVESASFQLPKIVKLELALPLWDLVPFVLAAVIDAPKGPETKSLLLINSPPPALRSWQWYVRTALPARAPSLLS